MEQEFTKKVTFMLNDGTQAGRTYQCMKNRSLGSLPKAERDGYELIGWFSDPAPGYGDRFTGATNVEGDIVLYAHWKKTSVRIKKSDYALMHRKDTRDNDDKDQTHLTPGSSGFKARQEAFEKEEDKKDGDPASDRLEEYNAQLSERLAVHNRQSGSGVMMERYHQESVKWDSLLAAVNAVAGIVKGTPDKSDDRRAVEILKDDSIINDISAGPDDVEAAAEDYIMFGRRYYFA